MLLRASIIASVSLVLAVPGISAPKQRKPSPAAQSKPPAVQPQPPAGPEQAQPQVPPPPPPTPEQGPSSPPDVTFQGGQLTIVARNSTMSDVLNAVRKKTGAAVDMPPATNERVVGQFGPGSPRDVLAQLLNGSHYDYVLLGSPAEPGSLNKVVLIARATGPEPVPVASSENPPAYRQGQNLPQIPQVEPEQNADDNSTNDVQPEMPQAEQQEEPPAEGPQQPPAGAPQVKTPEQLLRELQQQQQQQQRNQGQPPQ